MASVKFVPVSRGLKGILDYVTNREKTVDRLITGVNCVASSALDEFEAVKKQFHKTDGRAYYHIIQAFSPDDPLDFDTAHEIGIKFAEHFSGFQCVVVTHMNTAHIHNHIVMNSVSYETGRKFHQTAREMAQVKEFSNELCRRYGLSVTEAKADPFHVPKWKKKLVADIKRAMERTRSRDEFVAMMESWGYGVKWEDGYKYITYTAPDNIRCRDSKLFDGTLTRENMELYFEMGGCAYLESRQDSAARNGEDAPTVDDAVCGIANAFDALLSGDETRFHMETVYHSEAEIRKLLALGHKLSRTQVAVQDDDSEEAKQRTEQNLRAIAELTEQAARWVSDENDDEQQEDEEEFEQVHGFGMGMMM